MLLDRVTECAQIDHVLASAKNGMSAVLVLRGDAGTGKTALLDYAVDSAGDFDVVRLVGIESEAELGFAALHQLLVPYLGRLDSLPAPQRQALATVFGIREGGPPDRFLVGLASLTLLSGRGHGAAAAVRCRRRAVARSGIGRGPRLRRSPAARGCHRHALRRAGAVRASHFPRRAAEPPRARTSPGRGSPAACACRGGQGEQRGYRADHHADQRKSAGADRAWPRPRS